MRQLLVLCLLVLAVPASASADYRLLDDVSFPDEQEIAIAGGEVLAGSYAGDRDALMAFGLNGTRRTCRSGAAGWCTPSPRRRRPSRPRPRAGRGPGR